MSYRNESWHDAVIALFVFVIIPFCLLCSCFGGCACVGEHHYSEGYRDCVPQKLSHKGLIWHTYEGEAVLAGAKVSEHGAVANLWEYTVQDADIRKQLEDLPAGTAVRLHYTQVWNRMPWNGETPYRIVKVEELPK